MPYSLGNGIFRLKKCLPYHCLDFFKEAIKFSLNNNSFNGFKVTIGP